MAPSLEVWRLVHEADQSPSFSAKVTTLPLTYNSSGYGIMLIDRINNE
jgi:hypothetical protein